VATFQSAVAFGASPSKSRICIKLRDESTCPQPTWPNRMLNLRTGPPSREGLVFPGTLRSNCFFRPEAAIIDEQPLSSQLSSSVIRVPREIPKWIISRVRYPALWLQSFVGHCALVIRAAKEREIRTALATPLYFAALGVGCTS